MLKIRVITLNIRIKALIVYHLLMKKRKSPAKEKIKKAAIELFNNHETLSITTNHIAKAAGMSPGNLYYHYKNKAAIIIELYLDMSAEFESFESFERIPSSKNPLMELVSMFDRYGDLFYKYRFLMRDSAVLMAMYPELKALFVERQTKRIAQIELLLRFFIAEGILENIPEEEIPLRAKLNWFISAYWQIFASTSGDITKASIQEAKETVFTVNIKPFLSSFGRELLEQQF